MREREGLPGAMVGNDSARKFWRERERASDLEKCETMRSFVNGAMTLPRPAPFYEYGWGGARMSCMLLDLLANLHRLHDTIQEDA